MTSSALVLGKTPASKEALLKDVQAAYLDNLVTSWRPARLKWCRQWNQVWHRADRLYRKFCEKRAAGGLPPLAVLLSILWEQLGAVGLWRWRNKAKLWSLMCPASVVDNDLTFVHDCYVKLSVTQWGISIIDMLLSEPMKIKFLHPKHTCLSPILRFTFYAIIWTIYFVGDQRVMLL